MPTVRTEHNSYSAYALRYDNSRDFFFINKLFIFRRNITEEGTWVEMSDERVLFANGLPIRAEEFDLKTLTWLPNLVAYPKGFSPKFAPDCNKRFPPWPLFPRSMQAKSFNLKQFKKAYPGCKLTTSSAVQAQFYNALMRLKLSTDALVGRDHAAAAGFFRFKQSKDGPIIKAIHDLVDKRLLHIAGMVKLVGLNQLMAIIVKRADIFLPVYDQARSIAPVIYHFLSQRQALGLNMPVPSDNVLGYFKNSVFNLSDTAWRWLLKRSYVQNSYTPIVSELLAMANRYSSLNLDLPASVCFTLGYPLTPALLSAPDRVLKAVAEGAARAKKHGVLTSQCQQLDKNNPRLLTVSSTKPGPGHKKRIVNKKMKPFMAYSFTSKLSDVLGDFVGTGAEAWYIRKMTDTEALTAMLTPGFKTTAETALSNWLSQLGKLLTWDFLVQQSDLWHSQWSVRYQRLEKSVRSEVEILKRKQVWDPILETQLIGDYIFTPLCSGEALDVEGKTMRHCVHGSHYMDSCLSGNYRIYHVQHKDLPKDCTTLQLVFRSSEPLPLKAWNLGQNQGKSNHVNPPTDGNKMATIQFVSRFQEQWADLQATKADQAKCLQLIAA